MSWRQVYLVLRREYITRVKSKGFIAATILVPVGFVVLFGIGILISVWESDITFEIGVIDQTEVLAPSLEEMNEERYTDYSDLAEDSLRTLVQQEQITGYMILDEEHITSDKTLELIYSGSGGIQLLNSIQSDMREVIREERLQRAEVSQDIQNIFETSVSLNSRRLTAEGEETEDDTAFFTIVGMAMGFIIFFAIFGYGGYIMRGVIEEKTNRIVEVITSSVKPIELLSGKMVGVGALAITQFGIWIIALVGLSSIAGPLAASMMSDQSAQMQAMGAPEQAELPAFLDIPTIETSLIVYFILFFLLGYILYSSLFAAIGSAADSETDTQQLMMPVTIPIMLAYFIMFHAWRSPDSMLSVISSLVPFFSPIVMITRIAITEVPFWQIGLSMLLMVLTFVGTMWLSAKIYKVGILSYGGTASFKDIAKWIRQ
ncbi:ABC transporter permease [Rhodohalobacter sulfatireducens]|uniref:ABC transporter permease n=1 Tax=Rhodohalobacter sulfatireducens TaxID=2911366 RepID=A0ABS9KIA7_9BACT|nr:ABC transporter permease [Rhodohalobacter sulfatireducens]MCG2590589.1 ABC transporter permease [Rhodohalobacter sulfatireducens]